MTYKIGLLDGFISEIHQPVWPSQNKNSTPVFQPPVDTLIADPGWQDEVKNQVKLIHAQNYKSCLFGDSISAGLHNSIEPRNFNFALNGMSTVSLVEQLKILTAANLKCSQVIIAIGTNDAWYSISNESFIKNLKEIVTLAHTTGANQIVFIPAFYSTMPASHDSNLAGSNERIDKINTLIDEIGAKEQVFVAKNSIQDLFKDRALKESLTVDGVHLNEDGLTLYRLGLLQIINPHCHLL
ncbi:MAG: hypothetical protein NVS2B14_16940 [Chamaesiphon sp.]